MKKWIWFSLTAAALAAALAGGFGVHQYHQAEARRLALEESLAEAEAIHRTLHGRYRAALDAVDRSRLTVTEDDRVVGVYTLEDLGLDEAARAAVRGAFDDPDRLSARDFTALPQEEQLAQLSRADFEPAPVALPLDAFDSAPVLNDLEAVPRRAAVDCVPDFTGTGFRLLQEIPGTELDEARVLDALNGSMEGQFLTGEPLSLTFEVTDCDPYLPPEVTLENQQYDLNALLRSTLRERDYSLHVDLWGTDVALDADACADLLLVNEDGSLQMKQKRASALIADWAAQFDADRVPYCFSSYSAGKVSLPFLTVNCRLDQAALLKQLDEALCRLSADPVDAPFDCTDRAGRPVSFTGTYIEVDIARQTMTCFRDGELLVSTPVVSGKPRGHMTPSGSYKIQSKNTNRYLTGPDYRVFVQYWLGFYGAYGIHDAMWRSAFGDELYLYGGSHGCVNTPTEAMEQIYNCAEIGTPVLVFNIP